MNVSPTTKQCDVLVIGGGGAGALAALEASAKPGMKVIQVSRGPIGQSGLTPTANGGTHVVGQNGSPEDIFNEMVRAGRFLVDQDVAWFMVNGIGDCIERLASLGVNIVRFRDTSACVPGVETLRKVRQTLKSRPNVEVLEDMLVTRLFREEGRICGASLLDLATGAFSTVTATAVVLATGGMAGELYSHTSNNPFGVTTEAAGTGHAMAFLAGAELVDMEMMQFVPLPANPRALHIRYFPDFWEGPYLNTRGDIVEDHVTAYPGGSYSYQLVQKVWREMEQGKGPVYIDQRGTPEPKIGSGVKGWGIRRNLIKKLGIDPREHRIDLVIGSHFNTGGVRVAPTTDTSVPGLFAAGEIMGCVHGALRLPGYSFTQMIVFGFEAGRHAARFAADNSQAGSIAGDELYEEKERVFRFLEERKGSVSVGALKKRLQQVMEEHFFVVRKKAHMTAGMGEIEEIRQALARVAVPAFKRFNLEWARAVEFDLLLQAAEIMGASAIEREESRGFHHRTDFPMEDNKTWLKHTLARLEDGRLTIRTAPVNITRLKPEEA